jgi:branched-chain amino acid transport system ATP-binding protein
LSPEERPLDDRYILQTRNLSIHFGGLAAVNGVNLDVPYAKTVGLIGPNGSGKTTFFNLISGIYKPSAGEIRFKNEILNGSKSHQITRKGMARTFQNNRLFWQLSILDNVILGMYSKQKAGLFDVLFRYKRIEKELAECARRAVEILHYFSPELSEQHQRLASDLSQGDRRRVEISRALASDPDLLLLDEPSAGMSPEETDKLMEDIGKVKETFERISIILIEHDMTVIQNIADHVVVFNYGRKIAQGSYADIAHNEEVLEAYLGKETDDA